MGVYIKGMKMPTSCGVCKFFAWKRGVGQHCAVDDRITFHATIDGMDVAYERNGNCPLYNDEFEDYQTVNMSIDDLLDSSWIELEDAPTIIPAEGISKTENTTEEGET